MQGVTSARRKKAWLVSNLRGAAWNWYLGRRQMAKRSQDRNKMTYRRLKRAALRKWDGNPDAKVRTLKQTRCKGRSAEAVQNFTAEFAEKYHVIADEMTNREVKEQFIQKLPQDLQDKLRTINRRSTRPDTLFDVACEIAQGQEDASRLARPQGATDRPQNPDRAKCPTCFAWRDKGVKCYKCGAPPMTKPGESAGRKSSFKPRSAEGFVEEGDWGEPHADGD